MCAVLDITWRPESRGSLVIALVEERVEGLEEQGPCFRQESSSRNAECEVAIIMRTYVLICQAQCGEAPTRLDKHYGRAHLC